MAVLVSVIPTSAFASSLNRSKKNAEIQRIVDDMFDTMYAEEGIILRQLRWTFTSVLSIDVSENRDGRLVLINPELLEKSGETGIEEGCLSIPEQRALVPRRKSENSRLDRRNLFELKQTICWRFVFSMRCGSIRSVNCFIDYLSPLKQKQRIRQESRETDRLRSRV
ncbi:peptide deformylase [Enterobacter cloacae subsp. cloacae]|nr:peptide deformylase [Enterobacter cloacae subsp. cloacae]